MIELRWKRIPQGKIPPNFAVDIGKTQHGQILFAVLQYRESIHMADECGTRIFKGWDDWKDVEIENEI